MISLPTIFNEIGCDVPIGAMLAEALATGKALILLDGLDEARDISLRNTVIERVIDFYSFHRRPGNKFVITSRIVGYRDVRTLAEGISEYTLADFNDSEIDDFITKWTIAIEKQALGDTAVARRDAEIERRELLGIIETNEGVRSLASNPLLLTILALIKRRGITLPERRVQLYDQYITTLLSSWNRARSLSGRATGHEMDEVRTKRVLATLALWMHQVSPGVGLVKTSDLRRKLREIFTARSDPDPEATTRQFLEDVRNYASLLVERGTEEYGFIHLTFEEYLAAMALVFEAQGEAQHIVNALVPHIGEQTWREVALLTISYIGILQNMPRVAGKVAEGLAFASSGAPAEAAVLAGEAMLDAWPDGVTVESKDRVIGAILPAMQNPEAKTEQRRRAGLVLGKLKWKPVDLDNFVKIAPSKFLYGDKKEEREIKYPYWIAKYPVTNLQFTRFIKDGGYENRDWWSKDGWDWRTDKYDTKSADGSDKKWLSERRPADKRKRPGKWESEKWNNPISPVVEVAWFEAQAYCRWLIKQPLGIEFPVDYVVRLPSEEEWERAARFTDGRDYPWGDEFDPKFANTFENISEGTTAVCTYPLGRSMEGVWDISGNVWEWSNSWYDEKRNARVVRGGSWYYDRKLARCSSRLGFLPDYFLNYIGFRIVVSLADSEF